MPEQPPTRDVARSPADLRGRASNPPRDSHDLAGWLAQRVDTLRDEWIHEIRRRGVGAGREADGVLETFATELLAFLPLLLGPFRGLIEPLWDRAAALFGAVAAKRGLAAGEAIEELHVLRDLVVRELFRDPPHDPTRPVSLREVLAVNRVLDRAVTHTSIGHMDALFFEFFEGEAGPSLLSGDDVEVEARAQLGEIRDEVSLILSHAESAGAARLGH